MLVYLSISTLVFLAIVSLTVLLLFRFYRLILKSTFLGYNIPVKLINIAFTALLFRPAVVSILIKPLVFLFDIIRIYINHVTEILRSGSEMTKELFLKFLTNVYTPLSDLVRNDILTLNSFFALAFTGALTLFINKIFFSKEEKQYKLPTIQRIYPLQQNLFLFILMAFSLFLVLSAMIAIPFIGNPKNISPGNSNRFDTALANIKSSESSNALPYKIVSSDTGYLVSLEPGFKKLDTIWKRDATTKVISVEIDNIRRFFSDKTALFNFLIKNHNKSIDEFEEYKNTNFENIRLKLKEPSSKLAFGADEDYYGQLISGYSNSIRRGIMYFKQEQNELQQYDIYLKRLAGTIAEKIDSYKNELKKVDTVIENNSGYFYPYDYFNLNSISGSFADISALQYSAKLFNIPLVSKKSYSLFASIADWLTAPQSIDLVLIIGMFGFGLLGAAISSFITTREEDLKDSTTPLISNLSVVIIRGFSAAIVIFLATKGSIAVINSGTNDPNPYVLFFVCLVGSVFSERIWEWAKKQISTKFSETDKIVKPEAVPAPGHPKPADKTNEKTNDATTR